MQLKRDNREKSLLHFKSLQDLNKQCRVLILEQEVIQETNINILTNKTNNKIEELY